MGIISLPDGYRVRRVPAASYCLIKTGVPARQRIEAG